MRSIELRRKIRRRKINHFVRTEMVDIVCMFICGLMFGFIFGVLAFK